MAKTKISEFSTTAGNNTDINSINIAEGCAPSGINDAIRELMRQLKEFQTGGAGDSVNSGGDFSVATNKFTVASASGNTAVAGTLAVTGVATLTAQPILSSLTASKAVFTDASKGLVSNDVTGTGNVVMSNSPTLVTPALGTPASGVVTNLTGTASININGTVGATTPSTGAFTTLSSTGNTTLGDASGDTITVNGTTTFVNANPTLSAGTANGVLYLNGSKVATSGSALTFDGTRLGIGDAANAATLLQLTTASDSRIWVTATGGSNLEVGADTVSAFVVNRTNAPLTFGVNNAEAMRLNSTGLGIGTSSPGTKLHVANGDTRISQSGTGNIGLNILRSAGTTADWYNYIPSGSSDLRWFLGADVLTLTSSGNLGLGVTPSAFSGGKAIEIGAAGNAFNGYEASNILITSGAYYNGGWKYANSSYGASLYQQYRGTHNWQIAASGTAGNAITFTQAMTLDESGNLLVGTTSAVTSAPAKIGILYTGASEFGLGIKTSDNSGSALYFVNSSGTAVGNIALTSTTTAYNTSSDYRLKNVIGNVTGSGARIDALEPIEYEWKVSGERTRGFLAHKFQEVYPQSVTGTKDAVDADGNPVYQAMQASTSEVIADLVAEIQSLRKRLADAGIA